MKPIVTDTYDFQTLVGKGYVYVDKTALLRRMISGVDGRFFFMSRPRRFGKSVKAALKQCHSRNYAAPYATDRRRIVYVGVNYDTLKRNVDTLNDTLNSRMLSLVRQRPGLRRPDLMAALNVSESTVARYLREMRASVEFRGPSKTGGYFIKEGGA